MASKTVLNRELSWLQFNERVLSEAVNPDNPLLEQGKCLSIGTSNLDEFFMVRVGALQRALESGDVRRDPSGMTRYAVVEPAAELESLSQVFVVKDFTIVD